MAADDDKIYALYFDAKGCGPAPLALSLRTFDALGPRDEPHLGVNLDAAGLQVIASPAGGGIYFSRREDVERLRSALDAWLDANGPSVGTPAPMSPEQAATRKLAELTGYPVVTVGVDDLAEGPPPELAPYATACIGCGKEIAEGSPVSRYEEGFAHEVCPRG